MEKTEKVFAEGFMFKMKPDSPEWVVGQLSIKETEAIAFIHNNASNGWVNLNVNIGKSGKPYLELDTWRPKQAAATSPDPEFNSEGLPF
jgi:hypothetical protein